MVRPGHVPRRVPRRRRHGLVEDGTDDVTDDATNRAALVRRWRSTCADGDLRRFERRLAALGLDLGSVSDALRPRRFVEPPEWARTAEIVSSTAPDLVTIRPHELDRHVPFGSLYLPWLHVATERLDRRVDVPETLRPSLVAMLRARLRRCGEAVLLDEFRRSGMGHDEWIDHQLARGLQPLFESLPVWARFAATTTLDWIDAITDFVTHLRDDHDHVARLTGVDEVVPLGVYQDGDPHHHGRQVIVLTVAPDRTVVYKPRSQAPEVLARSVSDRLRELGVIDVDLVADVVDRGDHGWMQWIGTARPQPEQIARYSYHAGVTLAMAHRLAIADLHFENVLPVGDHPVLVDLECLGNSRPDLAAPDPDAADHEGILDRSVLRTCMLVSVANWERDGRDDSGLTGVLEAAEDDADASYEWTGLGTDAIVLERSPVRARCDDEPEMVDVEQVIAGLDAGEAVFDEHGLDVEIDPSAEVRVIAQNSATYAAHLAQVLSRSSLGDGLRCSIELDAVSRPGTYERSRPWRLDACEIERRALQRLDIPRFTVPLGSRTGRVEDHAIDALVEESGLATIEARRRDSGPAFRRLQRDVTRLVLDQRLAVAGRVARPMPTPLTASPADPLAVCEAIAVDLEARSVPDDHGGLAWLDIRQPGRFTRPILTDTGLMSGGAGVGLFLAALARTTSNDRWAALAARTLAGDPPADGHTLSFGSSGRGYAMVVAGALLDDQHLVERGRSVLAAVPPPERQHGLDGIDLLAGAPGIAAALAAAASTCGDAALAERSTEYVRTACTAWRTAVESRDLRTRLAASRIGVAHGITGIELAVARVIGGATRLRPHGRSGARRVAGRADRVRERTRRRA